MRRYSLKELSEVLGQQVKEIRLKYDNDEALEVLFANEEWPKKETVYAFIKYLCADCGCNFEEPGKLINPSCRECGGENVTEAQRG